jgi:hypothetical protein
MSGLSVPSKIYGILAAGRPVIFIGPEASEVATIIREAQCGYVIHPGDHQVVLKALLSYRADLALMQEHGRRARAYFDAHCSRTLGTGRFVRLVRGNEDKSVSTPYIYPDTVNGSHSATEKVVHW